MKTFEKEIGASIHRTILLMNLEYLYYLNAKRT